MGEISGNSQDIVYAFETLCYSLEKDKIFKEVNIIFDGYANKNREKLSCEEKEMMYLVEKGMAVKEFEFVNDIPNYAKSNGFKEVMLCDLSENVMPNMLRFKRIVTKCMKYGVVFKIICKILPKAFVGNAISGYLMAETTKKKLFCYMEHIYEKSK